MDDEWQFNKVYSKLADVAGDSGRLIPQLPSRPLVL